MTVKGIKKEIKKVLNSTIVSRPRLKSGKSVNYWNGYKAALKDILNYIDSTKATNK